MLVSDVQIVTSAVHAELRAEVRSGALEGPFQLWYRVSSEHRALLNPERGDPFVPALLVAAMRAGEPLEIPLPVSARLLAATDALQEIYGAWDAGLTRIRVVTPDGAPGRPAGVERPRIGLFFSLGIDSFYSLLCNVREHPADDRTIDRLLVVHGFDYPVDRGDEAVYPRVLANSRKVAEALGDKVVIPIATNLRNLMNRFGDWSYFNHGAGMASVGLALHDGFRRLHIAAGPTYSRPLVPCGSHPMLDPHWSTEDLTFVYDGGGTRRRNKAHVIADSPLALETLRVCPKRESGGYNCGRCSKCLGTMMILDRVDALGRCLTLPAEIDLDRLDRARVRPRDAPSFYRDVLRWLEGSGRHPDLLDRYQERLARSIAVAAGQLEQYEQARLDQIQAQKEDAALRKEVVTLRKEVAELRQEVAELRGHEAVLQEQAAVQRDRKAAILARNAALGEQVRALRERNAALRQKLAGARAATNGTSRSSLFRRRR